jgi:phage terminase large subunit
VDKQNGNILDEPVKFNDHAMDALRYAIYTNGIDKPKKESASIMWI